MKNSSSWIELFKEYTSNVPTHKSYVEWTALSVLAGALERKVWLSYNGTPCYPNLYVMLVGPPGLAKKSTISGMGIGLLKEVPDLVFMSDTGTQASITNQIHRAGAKRNFAYKNETYPMSAAFLYASEAVILLKESFGSIVQTLTDFYDCSPLGWSKTQYWAKETAKDGEIRIFNPCLNLLTCSTQDWLMDIISAKDLRGGFSSRMLFVYEDTRPEKTTEWLEDDKIVRNEQLKEQLIRELCFINSLQGQFQISVEGRKYATEISNEIDAWLDRNQDNKFAHFRARKFWVILKLAQIFRVDEMKTGDSLLLEPKHFEKAKNYYEELEPKIERTFNTMGRNKDSKDIEELWNYMRKHNHVTKEHIVIKFMKDIGANKLNELLEQVLASGKAIQHRVGNRVMFEIKDPRPFV